MEETNQSQLDGQQGLLDRWDGPRSRIGLFIAVVIHHTLALSPFLLVATMYGFTWRVYALTGHWPVEYTNDPSWVHPDDLLCELFYNLFVPLLLYAVIAPFCLPVSAFVLRRKYSLWYTGLLLVLLILGWILLLANPDNHMRWALD